MSRDILAPKQTHNTQGHAKRKKWEGDPQTMKSAKGEHSTTRTAYLNLGGFWSIFEEFITSVEYIGALSKLPRSETKETRAKTSVASKEETRRGGSGSGSGGRKSRKECS